MGPGFSRVICWSFWRACTIDAIDISATMIEQARRAVAANERIHWHICDAWDYQAGAVYDLISSSSSLQWMQPLDALFCRLASMLKPGGRLLCSLMVEGTLGELHRLRREIAPHKSPRDRLPTIAATVACLQKCRVLGLPFRTGRPANGTQQHRRSLCTIKELGFTGGPLATSSMLLMRGELKRLAERYGVECACPGAKSGRTTSTTTSKRSSNSRVRSADRFGWPAERTLVRL